MPGHLSIYNIIYATLVKIFCNFFFSVLPLYLLYIKIHFLSNTIPGPQLLVVTCGGGGGLPEESVPEPTLNVSPEADAGMTVRCKYITQ